MDNYIKEDNANMQYETFPLLAEGEDQAGFGRKVEDWIKSKAGDSLSAEALQCYTGAALKGLSTGTAAYKVGQWLDAVITPGVGTGAAVLIGGGAAAMKIRQCWLEEKARKTGGTDNQSIYLDNLYL